ncbi:MAG: quinone-dependent dihydroorotate dehydrogenase [Pseudomonadota bacterium]
MIKRIFDAARVGLLALDPENAHDVSLRALESGVHPRSSATRYRRLRQTVCGLDLPNPLGIAAGYDKDARVPDAMLAMGMGFAEVGTVTPLPQAGNAKPRVFRLPDADAVINRLGFNNAGHIAARSRLAARRRRGAGGVVGVNIGANKDSADRAADYVAGVETFAALASYFTVNVSSPNTPGLRDLQAPKELADLLAGVMGARAAHCSETPVFVKLAPDVAEDDLPDIVDVIRASGAEGICVSNTTLARDDVRGQRYADEAGGLSGAPLFARSTAMLARVARLTDGAVPLIGVGGVHSAATALAKIEAGASLVQLYTGLIYGGATLIPDVLDGLNEAAIARKASSIGDLVGGRAADWEGWQPGDAAPAA